VYGVHLSVVLLLIGGLIGSLFGFEGYVTIPEGQTIDTIQLRNSSHTLRLPFAIRCDDLKKQVYDTGAPKEWRVWLTVLAHGEPVHKKDIIVNDPLRFRGINIFLSDFGELNEKPAKKNFTVDESSTVELQFQSKATGMIYSQSAKMNQAVTLPEDLGQLVIKEFHNNGRFKGMDLGPTLVATLSDGRNEPQTILLPLNFPKFDAMRQGHLVISAVIEAMAQEARYYAGLQVTKDPGVMLVYAAFVLMIAGCFVAFFMSHQQAVIEASISSRGRTAVVVSGTANKNNRGFQIKLERLAIQLKENGSIEDSG
jgi:cytochrome c biogenesis protein